MSTTTTRPAVDADTVKFVKLGLNVSLTWRAPIRNFETFEAAVNAAGDYNEFDPAAIVESFRDLFGEMSQVELGRESSMVMYVTLPFWSHQRIGHGQFGMGERYTPEQLRELAGQVITWARSVKADEISAEQFPPVEDGPVRNKTGDNPYRIRVWWD